MASLIPAYEYDIFISYRQKDNKGDKWVTKFVDALKGELEATFKEEISVYFDINPQDGLLETHNVDASLRDKLKCLVFIPIISQTYCDPKCYAWQHEFCGFNKLAKDDPFGRDIKLAGGNVASRILPIKIHELDANDKKVFEDETDGILRAIEFIYREPGVNRPLSSDDDTKENLNKTKYRNQVNKVAYAVKEIITALQKYNPEDGEVSGDVIKAKIVSLINPKTKIIIASCLILVLIVLGYLFIPKLFKSFKPPETSIAVLPFKLLSNEPDKQYLADGMMDDILLHLSKIKDLRIISRNSVEQYRKTNKTKSAIGRELGVEYLLEGSFQKQGDEVKLIVYLIKAPEGRNIWANEYNRNWKDIFSVQSEVAQTIARELYTKITPEEKERIEKTTTINLKAYDLYLLGRSFWNKRTKEGLIKSLDYFEKSVAEDPDYALAYAGLADAYCILAWWGWWPTSEGYARTKKFVLHALKIDKNLAEAHATLGDLLIWSDWKWEEAEKELKLATELNPNYATAHQYYSEFLDITRRNDEARMQINMALELDPFSLALNVTSALYYYNEGKFNESLDACRKALLINPDFDNTYMICFFNYVKQGEDIKASEILQQLMLRDTLTREIANVIKEVYSKSGINGLFGLLIELELHKTKSSPTAIAWGYAILGKKEETLNWLEKAMKEHTTNLPRINNNIDFNFLRSDPRFVSILKQMGLSDLQAGNS
jgi:TolB-like protein